MALSEVFAKLESAVGNMNSKKNELDALQTKKDFEIKKLQQQIEEVEKNYEPQLEKADKAYAEAYKYAEDVRNETQQLMSELLPNFGQSSRVRVG